MTNNTTMMKELDGTSIQVLSNIPTATGTLARTHFATGGTFVCNGSTPVTVTEPMVNANSAIVITLKTVGGTVSPSVPYIATITAGTGFTVTGTAADTSTYNYWVIF